MNFKSVSIILAALLVNSKVLASPIDSDPESDSYEVEPTIGIENSIENSYSEEETTGLFDNDEECLTEECFEASKRIITSMDITANPCEDFYQYACGGWMNEYEIDDDQYTNNPIMQGRKRNKKIIRDILEGDDIKIDESLSEEDQKYDKINIDNIKNLYNTCKNEERINEKGKEPLVNLLNTLNLHGNIEKYKTVDGLTNLIFELLKYDVAPFLVTGVMGDLMDSNINVLALTQPNLYFAKESYENSEDISHYKDAVSKMLKIIYGDEKSDIDALTNSVVGFEQKIAYISLAQSELQNPSNYYNRYDIKKLNTDCSAINWNLFFEILVKGANVNYPINDDTLIITYTPSYFEKLNDLISETDIETLINYLEFVIIRSYIPYLSKDIRQPMKEFDDYLNGETAESPVEERCTEFINNTMGMAVSKYYIKKYYDGNIKESNEKIIENIKEAMINRIPNMSWLDESTSAYAINKVKNISNNIGYPDYVMQPKKLHELYEGLETVPDDYFTNILNLGTYGYYQALKKLPEKVDKDKWAMNPHEVNAYYRPTANSINFPAGIFQPPYFSPNVPDYLTYGGIGAVIGHELLHSLDDSGKQFDEHGDLHKWWDESTESKFKELTQCFIEQYDSYYIDEEDHVNGKLTLNENLADNGGVARAFEAWELSKSKNPEKAKENNKKLPGLSEFTPEQLFFISFGQDWCSKMRPGYAKQIVKTNEHSPANFRVIGVISNSEQFAKTFNCPANTKMNPDKKCLIW